MNRIQLLSENVANQIAAGEVIQRPASMVKELIENAIDAGASSIKLIVENGGKTLVRVVDNGSGMSKSDATLAFERHATSKIRSAEDLFGIKTMGFRGEALTSIASVARVELKTRLHTEDTGTFVEIEGGDIKCHESCACAEGSSFSVKNLFYNVPARRAFLKSDTVELKHIIDEFERIAIANPELFFSLHNNREEIFHLPKGSLKQRIVHIFGNNYNERLIPIEENTEIVNIKGFIGKPSYAKKTRGEQFIFLNKRFIKSTYINNAIIKAYKNMLPDDSYPMYTLFMEVDPSKIDINVHPTKAEVKFQNEQIIYSFVRAAAARSLGRHNISPGIDFDLSPLINDNISCGTFAVKEPVLSFNSDYNPFKGNPPFVHSDSGFERKKSTKAKMEKWGQFYDIMESELEDNSASHPVFETPEVIQKTFSMNSGKKNNTVKKNLQIHNSYILSPIKSGFILIDQQAAHEKILYERYNKNMEDDEIIKNTSQQCLFPKNVELGPADFVLLESIMEEVNKLGFDIRKFGKNSVVIYGLPAHVKCEDESRLLELLLESYKQEGSLSEDTKKSNLALSLAKSTAIKKGAALSQEEIDLLIDQLFACPMPDVSLSGKSTYISVTIDELVKRFSR